LERLVLREQLALQEQLDRKELQALWEQQEPQVLLEPLEPQDQ
jgi:ABC-type transporter Mla MlaB component